MIVYRLAHFKYRNDLSGKGAELAGGRWNSKGLALLYTGENIALCAAEVAVHIPFGIMPDYYVLQFIQLPKTKIETIKTNTLPKDWMKIPYLSETKTIGDGFVKKEKSLVLKVPSAVIPYEFNYLINPNHSKFKSIELLETKPFEFDTRLFKSN